MNQTMLIVVLESVVALLLVICGVLLALQFKKQAPVENVPSVLTSKSLPSIVAKRDSKNESYIASAREHLKTIESVLTSRLTVELTNIIPERRQILLDRLKQASEENFFETYSFSISFAKAGDIRNEIELRCERTYEAIFDVFEEKLLPATFNAVPDERALKMRELLVERLRAVRGRQVLQGQATLKMSLNPIYSELAEMARLQTILSNYLPKLQELKNRGTDWGNVAGFFSGTAMSAFHPIVGIPMLVGTWYRRKEKKKSEETFVTTALNEFANYLERWHKIQEVCLPVHKKQEVRIKETMRLIFEVSVPQVLTDLDQAGYSLKSVPAAYCNLLHDIQNDMEEIATT
jgi:hypothetical protein